MAEYAHVTRSSVNQLPRQGHLWLLSFLGAALIVVTGILAFGFYSLAVWVVTRTIPPPPEAELVIVTIQPPKPGATLAPVPPALKEKSRLAFTRTSPDQESAPPKKADFIGDRDTQATSDAAPTDGPPDQISQTGRDPRKPDEIETTSSRPQDGDLSHTKMASPKPNPQDTIAPNITPTEPQKEQEKAAANEIKPRQMTKGDTNVERTKPEDAPKTKQPEDQNEKMADTSVDKKPNPDKALPKATENQPGFRGNQQKTRLSGSISRRGKSSLNVANTALGRYHSALSRAVEAEWHKNCTKYRDFITPGTITVRFVIAPQGGIRSVSVVEMIDAGEVQKGFTLNSIRQASIPSIPADLKKELDGEPLELLYNFYF